MICYIPVEARKPISLNLTDTLRPPSLTSLRSTSSPPGASDASGINRGNDAGLAKSEVGVNTLGPL